METGHRRLGVLGGTFDPVHHGHLILASELRAALSLEKVLLVPNARSPFKPGELVTSGDHRAAMLQLAVSGIPWLELSTIELERSGVSYTVDTLRTLNSMFPSESLIFLMGADSLIRPASLARAGRNRTIGGDWSGIAAGNTGGY